MRICAGQMWSALFKYILTTAVICASQSLSSPEKAYLEDRRRKKQAVFCLLSTAGSEVRNDAVAVGEKKRAGLYSVATFVENIHRRLNEGGYFFGKGGRRGGGANASVKEGSKRKRFRWLDEEARSIAFRRRGDYRGRRSDATTR